MANSELKKNPFKMFDFLNKFAKHFIIVGKYIGRYTFVLVL